MRVVPSVGSGRNSPGAGMVRLLEQRFSQELRSRMAVCSPISPVNRAIDSIFFGFPGEKRNQWIHEPGRITYSELRFKVGGRVSTSEFRGAIEDLLAAGELIEVRLVRMDQRATKHLLIRPGRFKVLERAAAEVRGRPDILAQEPWAASLARDS
jgi:hypothetical protein